MINRDKICHICDFKDKEILELLKKNSLLEKSNMEFENRIKEIDRMLDLTIKLCENLTR